MRVRLMRQAGAVRIDHVMGLHRLFWVPCGMEATQGVYVGYPAEELHAILNVESHRCRSMIVGEDLGTVPESVTRAMRRHNIHGMSVLQFCIQPRTECLVSQVPAGSVASVNTHDMPTFAGFWQGRDLDDMLDLGLYKPTEEQEKRAERLESLKALVEFFERRGLIPKGSGAATAELPRLDVLRATLEYLGGTEARIVLVNLEDLWQELKQQNVPGTSSERQNWRHKARYSLEEFTALPGVRELLEALDRVRKGRAG
jgi:4-alpha-glucanotransferase